MPAINLARLKIQAAHLSEKFSNPEAFVCALDELLDSYTNRTMRATQTAQHFSLPTYRTPAPVLRQIRAEIEPLAEAHPLEAVSLTNALWKSGSLEARLLAAFLLGAIPIPQSTPAITRLPGWLSQSTDKQIVTALLTDALARLRRENPEMLFAVLEEWLKSPRNSLKIWGLRALIPILTDTHFENLPAVFRILKPAIQSTGPTTQLELQACLSTLEQVSRTETLSFLREVIRDNPHPLMLRTFRRILAGLSPELQSSLRELLRDQKNLP